MRFIIDYRLIEIIVCNTRWDCSIYYSNTYLWFLSHKMRRVYRLLESQLNAAGQGLRASGSSFFLLRRVNSVECRRSSASRREMI